MRTVLAVDDDPEICQLLVAFLGFAGFEVLTAVQWPRRAPPIGGCGDPPGGDPAGSDNAEMDGIEFRSHQRLDIRFREIPSSACPRVMMRGKRRHDSACQSSSPNHSSSPRPSRRSRDIVRRDPRLHRRSYARARGR